MMPFLPNQQEEQDQPQLMQQAPAPQGPQGIQQPSANNRLQGKSGSFTNLQKYLGANQGAAEEMGAKLGNRIQQELNAGYTAAGVDVNGPRRVAVHQDATQAGSALQDSGKDMGTIKTALKNEYGRPGYTPGQQTLDGFIVQQNQDAQQQIQAPQGAEAHIQGLAMSAKRTPTTSLPGISDVLKGGRR